MARLPLSMLHRLGTLLGWLAYSTSGRYAHRLRDNLGHVYGKGREADFRKLLRATIAEAGRSIAELPWVWRRPVPEVLKRVRHCYGLEHLQAARKDGKGLIMLTPHLGCFEIIGLYLAAQMPMTIMYRPAKLAWLDRLMREGRQRGQMTLVRTDIGGVRAMYKTLKRGETIGLLPDQVPGSGEGEWAEFFGRPAYTMTLVGRLMESCSAAVMMSYAIRLPHGEGYDLHFEPLTFTPEKSVALQVNAALERVIRTCPEQYLWSYHRYKVPSGALPPDAVRES